MLRTVPALPRPEEVLRVELMPALLLVRDELCMLLWLRLLWGGVLSLCIALPLPLLASPLGADEVLLLPRPLLMSPRGAEGVAPFLPSPRGADGMLLPGRLVMPLPGAGGGGVAVPLPPRGAMPPKKCPPAYPLPNGRGAA